ncbi:MAG: cyclic nucleotide-binding domain-containing protein [Gammaproteobacteria bacterium]|nr:cyclic nucleotide-binding domain-containing protein [Gammaproteobacteria bacterium]NNF66482.1 cyclic nucleotide-binding domain-containing protein [Gammaproteobacteria bacterium]
MSKKQVTVSLLKSLSPLDGLKAENLQALMKKTSVQEVSGGRYLFKEGESAKRTIYVLTGAVELRTDSKVVRVIEGGSEEARHPLAPMLPRKVTARARSKVEFISIDSDLLDVMLTWDQTGSYEVNELRAEETPDSDDWMTTLLQTKAFHKIPPANIQAIFMRMERVNYKAGDIVIKQGDEGDFFYAITDGRCAVTRETPLNKDGIKLAELRVGDTFGEEALISEAKRNATVTMLTDGTLMRLNKDDFNTLLNEPMLDWVEYEQAQEIIAQNGKWLDVRLPSEFDNFHQEGAVNIPLYFIRLKLKTLDPETRYVVCCDTGRRSSAGAYILSERGFDVYVLRGGLTMSGAADKAE